MLYNGTNGNDFKFGTNTSHDVFFGWGGEDIFFGLGGNDIFSKTSGTGISYGGAGYDQMSFYWSSLSIFADMATGLATELSAVHDRLNYRFHEMEALHGSKVGSDGLAGDGSNNRIYGWGGHDQIWGRAGNDWLWGGDGNDILTGGTGANYLEGGEGADTFCFAAFEKTTLRDFDPTEGDQLRFSHDLDLTIDELDTNDDGYLGLGDDGVRTYGNGMSWIDQFENGIILIIEATHYVPMDHIEFGYV